MWSKIISNLIQKEMMQVLLQKPVHTVGVVAGIASAGVGYSFATANIEIYKQINLSNIELHKQNDLSNVEFDKLQSISILRVDEEKTMSNVRTDEFKKKIPWPFRLFYV
jgi:hypothetical protein